MTLTVPEPSLDQYDYSTLPPFTQPYDGTDPDTALGDLRRIVEDAIVNAPRSLQKRIGPSEIGDPCDHCLAAKLAGWSKTEDGVGWLPFVGTAVHAELERILDLHEATRNAVHTTGVRFLTERRVMVGHIGGEEIWGSTDVFDTAAGMTGDWKIVGPTTLNKVRRHGPTPTYKVQAHLYGRGWVAAGYEVKHVAIVFLPRQDAKGWNAAHLWHEPYDEQVAIDALERANRLAANLTALASISTAARDAWISGLPRAEGCWDCGRYPQDLPASAPAGDLDGLLLPTPATAR